MAAGNTYTKIASSTLSSTATTVTFSSIAATYTDLVLICNPIPISSGYDMYITFNNDATTNYSRTYMLGDGSTASSGRNTLQNAFVPGGIYDNGTFIVHIPNYSNATTFKTALARVSIASTYAVATVGLWRKTPEAINRIDISSALGSNLASGSTFNLYGIAAA
jgi:hypothetical protein